MRTPKVNGLMLGSLAAIFAVFAVTALFSSGGGGSTGRGCGNLWVQAAWRNRGIRSEKPEYLIASPEFPISQQYDGSSGLWIYVFKNGKTYSFATDDTHLSWVDPASGERKIPVELTMPIIDSIKKATVGLTGRQFTSPEEFLAAIKTSAKDPQ